MLTIIFGVAFGHVMKWSSWRQLNLLWVGAVNYLADTLVCGAITVFHPASSAIAFTALTGAWAGASYLLSLLLYFVAVARLGMGLATSVVRLSVALPVAAALLVWHEQLHGAQAVGLLLVALALPLLAGAKLSAAGGDVSLLGTLVLPLFAVTGLGQLAARIFSSGAPKDNIYFYLTCLFAAAACSALLALAVRPVKPRWRDVRNGLILGGANLGGNLFLLRALRELPSAEVFSVSSAASVLLAAITGVLFWRERLARSAMGGVVAAAVAVVLLTR